MDGEFPDEKWQELLSAVWSNDAEKVKELVADVDVDTLSHRFFGGRGNTLLIEAVRLGNEETIDVLLEKGVNVNVPSKRGLVALGCYYDGTEEGIAKSNRINQKLLKHGAIDETGEYSKSSLVLAIENDDLEKIKHIIATEDVNAYNKEGDPVWAHAWGKPEILKILGDAGLDFDLPNREGYAALHLAVAEDNESFANYLIMNGSDPNIKVKGLDTNEKINKLVNDMTPLFFVKSTNMADLLITAGANVNAVSENGNTPVMSADSVELLTFFYEKGANMTVQSDSGVNLMSLAARDHNIEKIKFLQDCGLDINAADGNGVRPLTYAVSEKNKMFSTLDGSLLTKFEEPPALFVQQMIENGATVTSDDMAAVGEKGEAAEIKKILSQAQKEGLRDLKTELKIQDRVARERKKKIENQSHRSSQVSEKKVVKQFSSSVLSSSGRQE